MALKKEAERIFDEENINSDQRVEDAKKAVHDNIKKFESESVIAKINKIDPTLPIEKFEANTLEEAREWLRENLKKKGLSEVEIEAQVEQLTEESWGTGPKGSTAYIFQPKVANAKANPETHQFDRHQLHIINTNKSKAGSNWTARGHEILHSIVYKAFKASGKAFKPMAESMLNRLEETDIEGHKWLMGTVNERIKSE